MNSPDKDIAIIYNPALINEYVTNNTVSFRYPDPATLKAIAKAAKGRPVAPPRMKGDPLIKGVNWINAEYLEMGIKNSAKGQDWIERGILRVIPKRPLEDEVDTYTGTIADYKGKEGTSTEYGNIRSILSNTYDRSYLITLRNQCPALFRGEGVKIVTNACVEQIKRIDSINSTVVNTGDLYRSMQAA
jgi:hypothetical protein